MNVSIGPSPWPPGSFSYLKSAFWHLFKQTFVIWVGTNPLSSSVTMIDLSIGDKELASVAPPPSRLPIVAGLPDGPGIRAGLGREATSLSVSNVFVFKQLTGTLAQHLGAIIYSR